MHSHVHVVCYDCPMKNSPALLISYRTVGYFLLLALLFLVIGNAVTQWLARSGTLDRNGSLVNLFALGREHRLPTLYGALLLLMVAALLWLAGWGHRVHGQPSRAWMFLAFVFVFLSVDESMSIHERLNNPMKELVQRDGIFLYAWVVPYGIAVSILGLVYMPFLMRLPKLYRWLFMLSGMLYVGGALGFELIQGYIRTYREDTPGFAAEDSLVLLVEETMELAGVSLFICTLLRYLGEIFPALQIGFAPQMRRMPTNQSNERRVVGD